MKSLKTWLRSKYATYTPSGKMWLTIGVACLVVDMAIGYLAGYNVATFWHGVGYAALACGFAFLPDAAYEEFEGKRFVSAAVMALLCIPIGVKAYEQQLTYSAGMRSGEMQTVGVANAKYDGAQDDVARNRTELAALMATLEQYRKDAPWAVTVKADGLREQVRTLEQSIAQEGNPRNGGCKRRCLDLMKQKTDAEAKIATAERLEGVEARIKTLQDVIDRKREAANKAEHKTSLNVDVAKTTARLFKIAMGTTAQDIVKDDEVTTQLATLGSAGLGSLALLLLAPTGIFLAGRRRRPEDDKAPEANTANTASASPAALRNGITIVRTDRSVWTDLKFALRPQFTAGA